MSYINRNHKETKHPSGKGLDTTLYVDQNASQACQAEYLKIWTVWTLLFKKPGDFKIAKKKKIIIIPGYFSTLLVSIVINRSFLGCFRFTGCLIPAYSFSSRLHKKCYLVAIGAKWYFCKKIF